jgi:hypothetical protein
MDIVSALRTKRIKGEGDDENPNDTSVVSYSVEDSIIVNYFTPVV